MTGCTAVRSGRHDEAVELFTKVIDAGGEPGVLAMALTNRGLVAEPAWGMATGDRRLSRSASASAQAAPPRTTTWHGFWPSARTMHSAMGKKPF